MNKKDYKYEIDDEFINDKISYRIVDRYIDVQHRKEGFNEYIKRYVIHCNKCGAERVSLRESQIKRGVGCPCCRGLVVVEGVNDIPTTAPWMIPYFQGGYDEAKQYTYGSSKKIYPRCPDCGRVSNVASVIYNIYRQKAITCVCRDSISYPEKFIYNMLCQIDEPFEYQLTKSSLSWIGRYRYDFYLPNHNVVLEVHGLQHYEDENEMKNDTKKRELIEKNGLTYVALDCRYSDCEYIKESLLNSELTQILNLKNVDWTECNNFSKKNLCKEICELFEGGLSVTNLSEEYKLSKNSIRRMLHTGNEIGLCHYDGKKENVLSSINNENNVKETSIYTVDGKYVGTYKSAKYIADHSEEIVGKVLKVNSIYDCCNGRVKQYKGYVFVNKGDKVAV